LKLIKQWTSQVSGENMANSALNKKLKPSTQFAVILGSQEPLSRPEGVKRLWDYVKKHDLQNPENKREILADENLRPLFGKDKITMFEVGKIVNSNLQEEGAAENKEGS
jgi:upstream activation factor subunit UAF30